MIYSESELEPDSNFVINLVSDFDSDSESDSDSSLVFINLDKCIFLLYMCILLNKYVDSSILITESIVIQAMQV